MHKSFFQVQYYIFPLNGCMYSTVSIPFLDIQPDQNILDNPQVLGIHGSFEVFALADDNVEKSEHVADGDILQNVFKNLSRNKTIMMTQMMILMNSIQITSPALASYFTWWTIKRHSCSEINFQLKFCDN